MAMMRRTSKDTPVSQPSKKEFRHFEERNIGSPTKRHFRLQLVGSLACLWNSRAADIFANSYIKEKGRLFKREDLVACFKVHLRTLRNQYEHIKSGSNKVRRSLADVGCHSQSAGRTRRQ